MLPKAQTGDLQELKRKSNAETARKEEKRKRIEEGTTTAGRTIADNHHSSPVPRPPGHPRDEGVTASSASVFNGASSKKFVPPPGRPPPPPPAARPITDVLFIKKKVSAVPRRLSCHLIVLCLRSQIRAECLLADQMFIKYPASIPCGHAHPCPHYALTSKSSATTYAPNPPLKSTPKPLANCRIYTSLPP